MAVRLTPRARRSRIEGVAHDAAGEAVLRVSVTEAPDKGKANAALLRLLAKAWGVPRTALELTAGAASRRKTVLVAGDADALAERLRVWTEKDLERGA